MLPAIFGENLFDEMFDDMMRPMHSMEKLSMASTPEPS